MSDLFEFEEPEPVEASHLVRARCACGADALTVLERAREARCGTCALNESGADGRTHGVPGPVVRYGTFAIPPAEVIREAYPTPTHVGSVTYDERSLMLEMPTPGPVLSLAEYARENSWEVRSQYTRGHFPHGTTGRPGAEQHVISLRFGGHPMTDRQAYAVYRSPVSKVAWTWSSIAIWGPDLPPYLGCGVADLKDFLSCDAGASFERSILVWVDDLKRRAVNGEALRKARELKRAEVRALYAARGGLDSEECIARLALEYGESLEDVRKIVSKRGAAKEGAS